MQKFPPGIERDTVCEKYRASAYALIRSVKDSTYFLSAEASTLPLAGMYFPVFGSFGVACLRRCGWHEKTPLASRGGVYLCTETAWLHCRFLLEREAFAKLSEFFVIKSRCVDVDFLQSLYPVWGDDVKIDE